MEGGAWKCYCLARLPDWKQTYVGVTPDLDRRLRQHNGELSGGARATSGKAWERILHVKGFPDHRAALQFEWRWKQITRRKDGTPVERRMKALQELLALERPTTAAAAYTTYMTPPEVIIETVKELPAI